MNDDQKRILEWFLDFLHVDIAQLAQDEKARLAVHVQV